MIKSILVCTDGSPYSDVAGEYGIHLATRLGARLLGLHVLDSRTLEGPLLADISAWVGTQPYTAQTERFRELIEQRGETILAAFNDRCRKAGITPDSWMKSGYPARVILEEEARAELLIVGQKGEHAEQIGDMPGSNVERVVRSSIKPCLVTPAQFQPFTRILAAYDGSGYASKALHEAIELSLALKVELIVLTVAENGDEGRADQAAADAASLVKAHNCPAKRLVVRGKASSVILESARAEKCDLIVLGAFGHTRIREMILGSTTTQIINRSRVPVMLVR
jgi:nucleotide-binding universal stress UspA family protein